MKLRFNSAQFAGIALCLTVHWMNARGEEASLHGQITNVTQFHPHFVSPYEGGNSLSAGEHTDETTDITLFAAAGLWHDAGLYADVELDQGFGLSDTLGLAGFSSGEAYKVGASRPYWRVPRIFIRQSFGLRGERTPVQSGVHQLSDAEYADNVILTLGKFSVVDIFDTNSYAHDPRADFLNWAVIDAGAFDYAADAWGYTTGLAVEVNYHDLSWRTGLFNLSRVPNGRTVEADFSQFSLVDEIESRYRLNGRPGKFKLLYFLNHGRMGGYRAAVGEGVLTGIAPATGSVRRNASRAGFSFNAEQEINPSAGIFLRASANDGRKEAYEFTEINASISGGICVQGSAWRRPRDELGFAAALNELSPDARRYFAAGGLGILIGDGRLRSGNERILETFYSVNLLRGVRASFDYQYIVNPAYNRDRGPVSVVGLRIHAEL